MLVDHRTGTQTPACVSIASSMDSFANRVAPIWLLLLIAVPVWRCYLHVSQLTQQRLRDGFQEHHFSDLYPRWLGAREALLHGRDPYSDEITREIQRGYYGRPIDPTRPGDPYDEQRFAYPFYVVFILAPFVGLPFSAVELLFWALLLACAIWTVCSWIQAVAPNARADQIVVCVLAALVTFPYIQGLHLQQLSIVVSFLIAAVVAALARKKSLLAGVLLAFATIKPQLSIAFIGYVLLWSLSAWKSRRQVVIGFVSALAILVGVSLLMQPRWPAEFVAELGPYLRYTHATTGLRALLGRVGEIVILVPLATAVLMVALRARLSPPESSDFILGGALILAFTCVAIPSIAPHNQVLLTPGYILLALQRRNVWQRGRLARSLWLAAWLALSWPTAAATAFGTILLLRHTPVGNFWQLVLATNPLIPIVALLALIARSGIGRSVLFVRADT